MVMQPSGYRDRVVDVAEELFKFSLLLRGQSDFLVDRYSEREERRQKGRLLSQAEKEAEKAAQKKAADQAAKEAALQADKQTSSAADESTSWGGAQNMVQPTAGQENGNAAGPGAADATGIPSAAAIPSPTEQGQ